tara:strand:+ start:12291 stop:14258 length:1968 start_codon:yes stop_codon:yes gene_type:complete
VKIHTNCAVLLIVLLKVSIGEAAPQSAVGASPAEKNSVSNENLAEAYRLFLYGRYLADQENIDEAIQAYRQAAEIDLESGEIFAELATLYARQNKVEEAVEAAQQSLEREPDNQSANRILGLIYASRYNERPNNLADAKSGIEHLERARGTLLPDLHVEITLARLYLADKSSPKAIEILEELQKNEPGFSETDLLLARAYQLVGRIDDAIVTLERVVAGDRPSSRALSSLASLYGRQGRWIDAVNVYERAVKRNPRSARLKREFSAALLKADLGERARDVLDDLVRMRPDDSRGLALLVEVEISLGNFSAAEMVARRLVEVEPGGVEGVLALVEVYSRLREHQKVVDVINPVFTDNQLSPKESLGLYGRLGFAYEQLRDYEGAIRAYKAGWEIAPKSLSFGARLVQVYIDVGNLSEARVVVQQLKLQHPAQLSLDRLEARLLGEEGDFEAGLNLLSEALETRQSEPMAYVFLADFYSRHGRLNEAIDLLRRGEKTFTDNISILFQLGALLEQSDQALDAEGIFRNILNLDSNHAATLNYLGYMLADRGERLDESVNLLERAIKLDPYNGAYLDSLGWAYFKLDRLDQAERMLIQASKQMAWNSVIQDHLGDLMLKRGRYVDAISAWERALAGNGDEVELSKIKRKIGDARNWLER